MAGERIVPVEEIAKVALEHEIELDGRSLLLGYLFGHAVHEDRRLLTDREHLRAYTRSVITRLP